ncbi:unnamed protein product, partial [Prunus brigantina]
ENLNKFRKSPDQTEQVPQCGSSLIILIFSHFCPFRLEKFQFCPPQKAFQGLKQFRKDREAAMARIPNPDTVVQQLDLPYGPPPGLAWPYQENPLIAQIAGIPWLGEVQAGQRGEALPVQEREAPVRPEGPAPTQKDRSQSIPSTCKRRRGGRGNNLFANNDRNRWGQPEE